MRFPPTTPRPASRRRAQLIALAGGLGLTVSALTGPAASAGPDEPTVTELAEVNAAVDGADVDGVAWYTDPESGKVVVTADSTVSAAERREIRQAVGERADALTIKRTEGVFKPLRRSMYPGTAIYGPKSRCSLGFNVRGGGKHYLVTAGHCGNHVSVWHANLSNTKRIGPTVGYRYPGSDYALVEYKTRWLNRPGGYFGGKPYVGRKVTRIGSTSGQHSGVITAIGVTVRYSGGAVVRNMIQTNICGEPGDSGGPLISGRKALGITSGGAGECPAPGVTFFQPIQQVLNAYNVRLY